MRIRLSAVLGVVMAVLAVQPAFAQRTLQFDLNNLDFQSRNVAGANAAFGGLTHTGSVLISATIPPAQLVDLAMRPGPGQAFVMQPAANLTNLNMLINLVAGMVTGGTFTIDVNGGPSAGGDRYTANIGAAGSVTPFVGGGYQIEGLTSNGIFSDNQFATVAIPDFFGGQGGSPGLQGSFLGFRINPDQSGHSVVDVDEFVTAPTPGTLACVG